MEKDAPKHHFEGKDLPQPEREWGEVRFQEYLQAYPHLHNLGNIRKLEELVWAEIMFERSKDAMAKRSQIVEGTTKPILPTDREHIALQQIRQQVMDLQEKLGMYEENKLQDGFQIIQELQEKFAAYRKEHPLRFKCTCPFCAKSFGLKRKTENYEEFISPFFEDKVLNNRPLFDIYKNGRLTKEEVAKILGVNVKYVDWLEKHWYTEKPASEPQSDSSATSNQ